MAKHTATLDANETVFLCSAGRNAENNTFKALVNIYGDFDGGTVTLQISTDGGTTKVGLDNGTATIEATADKAVNINVDGFAKAGAEPLLYATMASATAPSVTVDVLDNI